MLRFIVRAGHLLTLRPYLRDWAGSFASHIEISSYDELFRSRRVPLCTHVFTDLECLTPEERESAAYFWNALERTPDLVRLLNHPLIAMRRYELLRHLHQCGINEFDAYRLADARKPKRFPVFVRVENNHQGPETDLIHSQEELDAVVDRLRAQGKCLESRIAIEFCAEPSPAGVYRKYGVFYVDGAVIPRHLLCSAGWLVKGSTSFVDEQVLEEEKCFIEENPHAREIREIFGLARINYGRIDYGIVNGKVQVYEINTNPTIISAGPWPRSEKKQRFAAALTAAFERLEESSSQTRARPRMLTLDPPLKDWRGRVASAMCYRVFGRQFRPAV
jgi:hypothetical protein